MSSSASSEAWSDDEQDTKKETALTKAEHSTPLIRPRHGEKLSFQAPPGYLPSPHSQQLLTEFSRDTLKENPRKQLWIIKIPEEVSPSALDGLVINIPSTSASTLAQLKIQTPVKGTASQTQLKSYSLRSQSSTSRTKDNGTTSTQLIAMAGGQSIVIGTEADQRMAEGGSLQIMLPQSHSQQGCYSFAHTAPKQYLRLILDDDARYDIGANESIRQQVISSETLSGATPSEKRKREQPIGKLNGSFLPAGARSGEDKVELADDASPSKAKKAKKAKSEPKEVKKEKKKGKSQ